MQNGRTICAETLIFVSSLSNTDHNRCEVKLKLNLVYFTLPLRKQAADMLKQILGTGVVGLGSFT